MAGGRNKGKHFMGGYNCPQFPSPCRYHSACALLGRWEWRLENPVNFLGCTLMADLLSTLFLTQANLPLEGSANRTSVTYILSTAKLYRYHFKSSLQQCLVYLASFWCFCWLDFHIPNVNRSVPIGICTIIAKILWIFPKAFSCIWYSFHAW